MESIEQLLYDEGYECLNYGNYKLFIKECGRYTVTIKHDFVSKVLTISVIDIEKNLKADFMQSTDIIKLLISSLVKCDVNLNSFKERIKCFKSSL